MQEEKNRHDRPEAFPRPSEVDTQLKHQDEFNEVLNNESSSHNPSPNGTQADQEEMKEMQQRMSSDSGSGGQDRPTR